MDPTPESTLEASGCRTEFTFLETPRLHLRRFTEADLPIFVAYRNDPEVARYQGWETCTDQQAADFLAEQKTLQPGIPGEGFQFAMESKETGTLIGDCYLKVSAQEEREAEIGFTLARAYQGCGFALEAVTRLLDLVFLEWRLHRVVAITDCRNHASVALLERLGMRREGHLLQNIWFKGQWGDEYLYAILHDEWEAAHP